MPSAGELHEKHVLHLEHLQYLANQKYISEQTVQPVKYTSTPVNLSANAMQTCIIRAESGGNPQIWNASGHWGLYQFSYDTWVAHGGIPADFGHADAAEQTQIFWQTVAQDGYTDWTPYDGC